MKDLARLFTLLIFLSLPAAPGCDSYNPDRSTATSGRLVVLVDEMYAPLIREMADTFMTRSPATRVTVQPIAARTAVQEWINRHLADTSTADTATTLAIILGRELLADEKQAIAERNLNVSLIEIPIAYDGLAVVVPQHSPLQHTTVEQLRTALSTEGRTTDVLQEGAGEERQRFIFSDPNSSAYGLVRDKLLEQGEPAAPAAFRKTTDSVLDAVAAGEGIALMSWYRASLDSNRVRTLELGFTDSTGTVHPPVQVHPSSLVMGLYPLKLRIVGLTFAGVNSTANGFLTWLAQSAQRDLVNRGLEGENVRYTFTR